MEKRNLQNIENLELGAPSVFCYLDYRKYLFAYYEYKKSLNPKFSYHVLSRLSGMNSASYMKLVISGKRNLPEAVAEQVAKACYLEGNAREFFLNLVKWNQCSSALERETYWKELLKYSPRDEQYLMSSGEAKILTKWYVIPLLELIATKNFKMDYEAIAAQFIEPHKVTAEQVRLSYQLLMNLGLIKREGERYVKTNKVMFGEARDYSELAKSYYTQTIPLGADAILTIPRERREFASTTLSIRKQDVAHLKKEIQEFYSKILDYVGKVNEVEEVFQLAIQFFPVIESKEDPSIPEVLERPSLKSK